MEATGIRKVYSYYLPDDQENESFDPNNRYLAFLCLESINGSQRNETEKIEAYRKYEKYSIKELILKYLLKDIKHFFKDWKSDPLSPLEYRLCMMHVVAIGHLLDFDFELLGNQMQNIWFLSSQGKNGDAEELEEKESFLDKEGNNLIQYLDDEESFIFVDSIKDHFHEPMFDTSCNFYLKCGQVYVKMLRYIAAQANRAAKLLNESIGEISSKSGRKKQKRSYPKEIYGPDLQGLGRLLMHIASIAGAYVRLIKPDLEALDPPPCTWKARKATFNSLILHFRKSCTVLNSSFTSLLKNKIYILFEKKMKSISYDEMAEIEYARAKKDYARVLQELNDKDEIEKSIIKATKEHLKKAAEDFSRSQVSKSKMLEFDKLAFGIKGKPQDGNYGALMGSLTSHIKNIKEIWDAWNALSFFTDTFHKHLFERLETIPEDEVVEDYDLMELIDELESKKKNKKRSKRERKKKSKAYPSSSPPLKKIKKRHGVFSPPSVKKEKEKEKKVKGEPRVNNGGENSTEGSPIKHLIHDLKSSINGKEIDSQKHLLTRSATLLAAKLRQAFSRYPRPQDVEELYEAAFEDACDHLFMSGCGMEMFYTVIEQQDFQALHAIVTQLILDWHGMAEQSRNMIHLHSFGEKSPTHHLALLSRRIDEFPIWREGELSEIQQHLVDLDNGLMWVRFPKSQSAFSTIARSSKGLNAMRFAAKIASKIRQSSKKVDSEEIEGMKGLIEFVTQAHLVAWTDMVKQGKPDKTTKAVLRGMEQILELMKTKAYAVVESCEGQTFLSLKVEDEGNFSNFKKFMMGKLTTLKKIKKHDQEITEVSPSGYVPIPVLLADSKWHFKHTLLSTSLYARYFSPQFDAWFIRNIMQEQYGIEQTYRFIAAKEGVHGVKSHSFVTFQRFLSSKADTKVINIFNLGTRIYYPHLSQLTHEPEMNLMTLFMERIGSNQRLFFEKSTSNEKESELKQALETRRNIFKMLKETMVQVNVHLKEVEERMTRGKSNPPSPHAKQKADT